MRLVIPEGLWAQLLDELARQRPGEERVAYLDGFVSDGVAVATTVTIPDAECTPGYYTVGPEQMSQAGAHLRRFAMRRVAQVHTHGGADTTASSRDERLAYSQRAGALSLVLPYHAVYRPSPHDGSVNLRTEDGWTRLSAAQSQDTVSLVPSMLDHRREAWTASRPGTMAILTAGFARAGRRLRRLSLWRSRRT